MTASSNKVLTLSKADHVSPNDLPNKSHSSDNSGGGEPPMEKYDTHEELQHEVDKLEAKIDLSTEKMMHHMDVENANMKSELKSVNTTLAFITGILIPIITAILLKFFHLN